MSPRDALRDHLLTHSVKRGNFTLKSGRTSTWFIDSKQTVCRPEAMLLVADAVLALMPPEATAIGGLTMGADPVAFVTAGVAATRGRPLKAFSVRKEAKDHGAGGRIAGALDPGDRVVVTEDTVTRGTSLLSAAHAVAEAGAEVVLLVADPVRVAAGRLLIGRGIQDRRLPPAQKDPHTEIGILSHIEGVPTADLAQPRRDEVIGRASQRDDGIHRLKSGKQLIEPN